MNRNIVITGASEGIGAALARVLVERGDRVVVAARRDKELEKLAAELGDQACAVPCDVTVRAQVERLRDRAIEAFGHIDVWINNAGRAINRPVLQLTDEDIDAMVAMNVKSALYGMQAVVPHFQARNAGHLVNVSSFLGKVPMATVRSAYSAMKAALNSLTANLRMDLAATHPNIHVSLVMPGIVLTNFASNALHGAPLGGFPATGPAKPQSPEAVAKLIADLLDAPRAELYTNPAHLDLLRGYVSDVAAFEAAAARR